MYDSSLKVKWDNKNVLDYAVATAKAEAEARTEARVREEEQTKREKEQITIIKNLIVQLGLSDEQIVSIAGAPIELVKKIRAALDK